MSKGEAVDTHPARKQAVTLKTRFRIHCRKRSDIPDVLGHIEHSYRKANAQRNVQLFLVKQPLKLKFQTVFHSVNPSLTKLLSAFPLLSQAHRLESEWSLPTRNPRVNVMLSPGFNS